MNLTSILKTLTTGIFITCLNTIQIQAQNVDIEETKRIINFLASDELKGRKAGSKEGAIASDFIAEEFKKLNLTYLEGLNSYFQSFELYQVNTVKESVKLNKTTFNSPQFFTITDLEKYSEKKAKNLQIVSIKKEDNFREKFGEYYSSTTPILIVVDTAHQEAFSGARNYFVSSPPKNELNEQHTSIWVLSSETNVKKVKISIEQTVSKLTLRNVVGVLKGKSKPEEIVLFSAHYDHIGILPEIQGDSIANGADDDASGVTAMLQIAQHYAKKGNNERTVIFTAFDGEEAGLKGSTYYASKIDPEKYIANVNIEMIGKPSDRGIRKAYITGFDKSSLGKIFKANTIGKNFKFFPDPYVSFNLFMRSDNASFAKQGIPAHTISSDPIDFDSYYHTVNDEIETLDLKNMRETIKAIIIASESIISGKDTPSRVKYEHKK